MQTTVSGRIVDIQKNPMSGIEIGIQPIDITKSDRYPSIYGEIALRTRTDSNGDFSISGISSVPVEFKLLPVDMANYMIKTIDVGGVTLYSHRYFGFSRMPIGITKGQHLKNMLFTVEPRMKISGQIIFNDGTPLRNRPVKLDLRPSYLWESLRSRMDGSIMTDKEGYFTEFVRGAATYTLSVEYFNLSAFSDPIVLQDGDQYDKLVLKLSEDTGKPNRQMVDSDNEEFDRWRAMQEVWVVNPANGHAYKTIRCKSWWQAKRKAEEEDAYLVSINNVEEQNWIESLFSQNDFYWIGLRLTSKGEKWHNKEQIAYSNFAQNTEVLTSNSENKHVVLDAATKKWIGINKGSPFQQFVQDAIIEKDEVQVNSD
ncbi:hypothetical protein C6497_02910 [Candidatus Poribacteria bacterium]|nr:MAG: hypothetical protein C6497_02910 [Candidatus Poribacteria bacterium]